MADSSFNSSSSSCQLLLTRRQSVLPVSVVRPTAHVASRPTGARGLSTLGGTDRCGTESNPWNIVAWRSGQRFNVTTIDLKPASSSSSSASLLPSQPGPTSVSMATGGAAAACRHYVRLRHDSGVTSSSSQSGECDDVTSRRGQREMSVLVSDSGQVELVVDRSTSPDAFMLLFKCKYSIYCILFTSASIRSKLPYHVIMLTLLMHAKLQ